MVDDISGEIINSQYIDPFKIVQAKVLLLCFRSAICEFSFDKLSYLGLFCPFIKDKMGQNFHKIEAVRQPNWTNPNWTNPNWTDPKTKLGVFQMWVDQLLKAGWV